MAVDKKLLSVGLDVGTTSTQLVLSGLTVRNQASSFTVPRMEITQRQILYRSPVYFTPLSGGELVDGAALRKLVEGEYKAAGITREQVDTGAVIVTGETSRKENARRVLKELSDLAGEFVVAAAGPDMESVLAARGAGAVENSRGKRLLHMDIGGGTSNLCLLEDGRILATGCFNVGGRLLKLDKAGRICSRSPVLEGLTQLQVGDRPSPEQMETLARTLTRGLEMAAGLRPADALLTQLATKEAGSVWQPPENVSLSFSGGVADCIRQDYEAEQFGDMGPVLGRTIRQSRLCRGAYFLGKETIRATVIGAGCHSMRLSGSTVFYRNIPFPLKNLPVAVTDGSTSAGIRRALVQLEGELGVIAITAPREIHYKTIQALSKNLREGFGERPILVSVEQDMAKALGQCLALQLPEEQPCLCIDGLALSGGDYLDVGEPVGPALPVVIKSLVLGGNP